MRLWSFRTTVRNLSWILVLILVAPSTPAQVATGVPPFSSVSGGPDMINLGNLNAHWVIPIRHKPGRGLNFDYDLAYDSSIWMINSSTWQPVTSKTIPGWEGLLPAGYAYITYAVVYSSGHCGQSGQYSWQSWNYSNFKYYDAGGIHSFGPLGGVVTVSTNNTQCPPTQTQPPSPWTGFIDGFTMTVTPGQGTISVTLVDSSGATINAPILSNPSSGSISSIDRSGNKITSTNGSYTDTLGYPALSVVGTAPSNTGLSYAVPSGASPAYVVSYKTYTVRTNFGCSGITEYNASRTLTSSLVDKITLPDGSYYQLGYETTYQDNHSPHDVTGRVTSVRLPSGGTISYAYATGGSSVNNVSCSDGSATTLVRTTPDGTWTYIRSQISGNHWQTLVTDPATPTANQTLFDFMKDSGSTSNFYETQRAAYQGSTSGTLLLTTVTCYNNNLTSCPSAAITSPILQKDFYRYFPGLAYPAISQIKYDSLGRLIEDKEMDFVLTNNGSPYLTDTTITYLSFVCGGTGPQQVTIKDPSGNTVAQTTYSYDQFAVTTTSGTPQFTPCSNSSKGNPTTIQYRTQGISTISKTFTYFDTGNVRTATDFNGAITTFNYNTGSCGNSFPVSVSEPLNLSKSFVWNCTGGVLAQVTDENLKNTNLVYSSDPFYWRPDSVNDPTGAVITFCYGFLSTSNGACTRNNSQLESALNFNSNNSTADTLITFDALGRSHVRQIRQSPSSTTFDSSETDFDTRGRPNRGTLAYSGTAGQTNSNAPAVTITYDALGRVAQTNDAGGGTINYLYNGNDVSWTINPAPIGESSKSRQLEYDALGRLTSVCEITSASGSGTCGQNHPQTGLWTKYTYDALGDVTGVTQNAQAPAGSQQTRSFSYDGLGRLTSETNPENGTRTYVYDTDSTMCGNGAYTSNGDLVKTADAAGNCVMRYYDALHRITDVGNSNQALNHCKRFRYDNSSGYPGSTKPAGLTNTLGRLIEAATDACNGTDDSIITDEWFGYTARGEISDEYQSSPNSLGYYHATLSYWPNGMTNQLSNLASLPTFTYGVDGEGRITSVSASAGQNPLSSTIYNTASLPTAVNLGSGDNDAFTYDTNTNRMTQYKFNIGTQPQSFVGGLIWNANGTLGSLTITDPFNSADNQTCSYSHDDLVRIASANCGSAANQTFSYDPFGNITKTGSPGQFQPEYDTPTNHLKHIPLGGSFVAQYDSNGNVLNDNINTYTWSAYDRPLSINGHAITYDALDRMVDVNYGSSTSQFLYGPDGLSQTLFKGQTARHAVLYLPGGAQAVYDEGQSGLLYYGHSDYLGTIRLQSTPSRTFSVSTAVAPFGEPYAQSTASATSFTGAAQNFTLDLYDMPFREYSDQGRWASPDPAGLAVVDLTNPQSLNRYAYVTNNPLAFIDPLGLSDCPDQKATCGDDWTDPCNGSLGVDIYGGGVGNPLCDNGIPFGTIGNDCMGGPCVPFSQFLDNGCIANVSYYTVSGPGGEYSMPDVTIVCPGGHQGGGGHGGSGGASSLSQRKPSCPAVFATTTLDDLIGIKDLLAHVAAETGVEMATQSAVASHVARRGLVVPLRSSVVRRYLLYGEVASDVLIVGPLIKSEVVGFNDEVKAWRSGACTTIWSRQP